MLVQDLFAAFVVGLFGAGHCLGMCGGIASLINLSQADAATQLRNAMLNSFFYNIGRLLSYSLAGLIVATASSNIAQLANANSGLIWLRILSALIMIVLALYIGRWWQGLVYIEKLGAGLWAFISPQGKKLLPLKAAWHAIPFGFIWGWLPCGLVYSMLTWSAAAGDAWQGSAIMLAFGVGTLPAMLFIGISSGQMGQLLKTLWFRRIGALSLLLYGIYQLHHYLLKLF